MPVITPIIATILLLTVLGLIFIPGPGWTFSASTNFWVFSFSVIAAGRIFVAPVPALRLTKSIKPGPTL